MHLQILQDLRRIFYRSDIQLFTVIDRGKSLFYGFRRDPGFLFQQLEDLLRKGGPGIAQVELVDQHPFPVFILQSEAGGVQGIEDVLAHPVTGVAVAAQGHRGGGGDVPPTEARREAGDLVYPGVFCRFNGRLGLKEGLGLPFFHQRSLAASAGGKRQGERQRKYQSNDPFHNCEILLK